MANPEQVMVLKKGATIWNIWREKHFKTGIDLTEINLRFEILSSTDHDSNIINTAHNHSNLNLREANLMGANLLSTNLSAADLKGANLSTTDFSFSNLEGADFRGAILMGTNFRGTNLKKANISKAKVGFTIFANDLSETIGLDDVIHDSPSILGIGAIQLSKGKIPLTFLRGCGLSDVDIEYARLYDPDLSNQQVDDILYKIHDLRAHQSVQVSPLFISYSHADAAFVDRLDVYLNSKGIRFWRDIHDAKAGRLEKQIEQAIRLNPTVLVILSENSIQSDWVQHEVREARALEKELKRDVLCPVALDGSWKTAAWPKRVMQQVMEYNILDFSKWEDEKVFEKMFVKLLDGLQLFYKA